MGDVPETTNADEPKPKAAPRLEYDPGHSVYAATRRFRMLMGLTLLNTLMIAALFVGPYLMPLVRQKWEQFQAAREMDRERQRVAAIVQQCLNHAAPPNKVMYEEDPTEAAKLQAAGAGGYVSVMPGLDTSGRHRGVRRGKPDALPAPPGYQPPARAATPEYVDSFFDIAGGFSLGGGGGGLFGNVSDASDPALLFLHERKAPGGERLLVEVWLQPGYEIGWNDLTENDARYQAFGMRKHRRLFARAWTVPPAPAQPQTAHAWTLVLVLPDVEVPDLAQVRVDAPAGAGGPEAGGREDAEGPTTLPVATINYGSKLRVFAGQPDRQDASRFTIDYQLDGRRGTVDGRVRDDGIVLRPREGKRADNETAQEVQDVGADEVWDLRAPSAGGTE